MALSAILTKLGFNGVEDRFYALTGLYHPSDELAAPERSLSHCRLLSVFDLFSIAWGDIHRIVPKALDKN